MSSVSSRDERDELISRLQRENDRLADRLTRIRPALDSMTVELVRSRREAAEWRRRYRLLRADQDAGDPSPPRRSRSLVA